MKEDIQDPNTDQSGSEEEEQEDDLPSIEDEIASQDNKTERESMENDDRGTYSNHTPSQLDIWDENAKNKLENSYFAKLIIRFKEILEQGVLTVRHTISLNYDLAMIQNKLTDDPDAKRSHDKFKEKLRKIDQQTFNWKVDFRSLPNMRQYFNLIDIFYDNHHYLLLDYKKLQEILPTSTFEFFMQEPYHSYDEHDQIFFEVTQFHSLVITTFKKLYISFPMAARPRIYSGELNLVDPFMREYYRKSNREYFNNETGLPENFNLIDFIGKIMEKFVFSGLPRWEQKSGQPLLVPLLLLLTECFDYGLANNTECDLLLGQLYMISELLSSLENQINRKFTVYEKSVEKYYEEFMTCRIAISKILIHIIGIYCDYDYIDSVNQLKINPASKTLLKYFLFTKPAAYSNISLIILKYLSPKLEISKIKHYSQVLEHNISLIFNFIGDYENDFFTQSLSLIRVEYTNYYLGKGLLDVDFDRVNDAVSYLKEYITLIQTAGTANLRHIESNFIDLLRKIRDLFVTDPDNVEIRLELSKNNVPALLLQIIDYLDRTGMNVKDVVHEGLAVLGIVLKRNYAGQSVLFTGHTFNNYQSIFSRRNLATMNMLQSVFEDDYSMFNLANKVFLMKVKIYQQLIKSFKEEYEKDQSSQKFIDILGSLFYFNYFFDSIMDKNLNRVKHKKRYDVVIASEIVGIMTDYVFPALYKPDFLPDYNNVNFKRSSDVPQLRNFGTVRGYFSEKDSKVALFEIYFSFLKLFNKCTFHVYSGEVYEKVKNLVDTTNFSKLPIGFPNAIYIRIEMIKLFDRFHVFYSNHMLSKRGMHNKNKAVIIGEVFIPNNTSNLCQKIKSEFEWFKAYVKIPQNSSNENSGLIGKYLLKGLLAMVYKYLKGIHGLMTMMEDNAVIETLKNHCDEIVDLLISNAPQYTNYIQNMLSKAMGLMLAYQDNMMTEAQAPVENETLSGKLGAFLRGGGMKSNLSIAPSLSQLNVETNFESDIMEERINPHLRTIRERIMNGIDVLNKIYDINGEFRFVINRFIRNADMEAFNPYMMKNLRSFHTLQAKFSNVHKKLQETESKKEKNILQTIKKAYRGKKEYYHKNYKENRFVQYLTDDINKHNYSHAIAEFFVDQMVNMESCLKIENYETSFFINEVYMQYIITINNLLSWTDLIRFELFKILYLSQCSKTKATPDLDKSEMGSGNEFSADINEGTILSFMQAIWGAYLSLLMFVYFKTFMDQEWDEYWSKFFIVSTFLQNFCENNFVRFKELLNKPGFGMIEMVSGSNTPGQRSIFFENYILLEVLAMNSNFWLNKDDKIVPSDRPELFQMMNRVMENVTEMLNGPCLENQKKIYIYRIDMWTGIINRIIEDIDSKFYEVKLNCLKYISALLEGLDDEIVQFMGSNLEVHKLFDMIILLTRKLYIKQKFIVNTQKSKDTAPSGLTRGVDKPLDKFVSGLTNIALNVQSNTESIRRPDQLFAMFNKYEDFSEHIIMNIIIETYVLIKSMSTKIKFYNLFLKEKERIAKNYFKETKNRDEAVIYNFISKVIANVEIVYTANNKKSLVRFYFKMPPRCFFLTSEMMNRFMDETPVDSLIAKRNFLYNHVEALSIEMYENQKNFARFSSYSYAMTNDAFKTYQMILILIATVLNIIMLVYLENPTGKRLESYDSAGGSVILALGIAIASFSFVFLVLWLVIKYKMEIRVQISKHQALSAEPLSNREKTHIYLVKALIFNRRFSSFFLQLTFSLLGIFVSEVFFTLNLLLLTNLSKPISYIMQSIIKHYDKLLVTFGLTILVIFSYSFILMTNYAGTIDAGEFGEKVCENFVSCFFNSVNLGLRLGGGIGDSLKILSNTAGSGIFWGRFFFDLSFFILVRLILLNVIAGIIIDTFSDLRDDLTIRNRDAKNICFMCGIDRWKLEQNGVDFDDHINNDHNRWKYICFIIKLSLENQRSFTGIEYKVSEMYNKNDSSWIPSEIYLNKGESYKKIDESE